MSDTKRPLPEPEPPNLRFLRLLVTVLTGVMIAGLLVVIGLLVTRFPKPVTLAIPEQITLPDGAVPTAVTQGEGWWAVVTQDQRILIYRADGSLRQEVVLGE